jgi:hypothetical protein
MGAKPLAIASKMIAPVGRGGKNHREDVILIQTLINTKLPVPLQPLRVDGHCGPATIFAIEEIQRRNLGLHRPDGRVEPGGLTFRFLMAMAAVPGAVTIAWGAKVSSAFKQKVIKISNDLGVDPNFLMAAMAFETGESFSPSIKNNASGATGLIQFMPSTATSLGTSTSALAAMTAEAQLDYVAKYFAPYKNKLSTVEDVYMVILWPAAVGKPNGTVLFSAPSIAYEQNKGLDANHDGKVTKAEAAAMVRAKLAKGEKPGFRG